MKPTTGSPVAGKDVEAWAPLMELAVREVFEMMLSSPLQKPEGAVEGVFNATSMVGFGGKMRGLVTFSCGSRAAALMAGRLLRVEVSEGTREVQDALGEICNMVAGNFKNKVAVLGEGCVLSVPVVITGTNYSLHSLADSAGLEVRFLFENMPIVISLRTES